MHHHFITVTQQCCYPSFANVELKLHHEMTTAISLNGNRTEVSAEGHAFNNRSVVESLSLVRDRTFTEIYSPDSDTRYGGSKVSTRN
jgi:hypothetical protein